MEKELFIETINQIQKQVVHDRKCSEAFDILLPNDYTTGYDNNILYNQIIKLLQVQMSDESEDSWIEYYIWELDFGKRDGNVYIDGRNVQLKTPSDLWNLLTINKNT